MSDKTIWSTWPWKSSKNIFTLIIMSILACEKNEQFTSLSISQYIQYIIVLIPFYLEFILENSEKIFKNSKAV